MPGHTLRSCSAILLLTHAVSPYFPPDRQIRASAIAFHVFYRKIEERHPLGKNHKAVYRGQSALPMMRDYTKGILSASIGVIIGVSVKSVLGGVAISGEFTVKSNPECQIILDYSFSGLFSL